MTVSEQTCDDCGLPISICNARAMIGRAAFRHGGAEVAKHMGLPSTLPAALALPEVQALVEALRVSDEFVRSLGYDGIGNITSAALRAIMEGGE